MVMIVVFDLVGGWIVRMYWVVVVVGRLLGGVGVVGLSGGAGVAVIIFIATEKGVVGWLVKVGSRVRRVLLKLIHGLLMLLLYTQWGNLSRVVAAVKPTHLNRLLLALLLHFTVLLWYLLLSYNNFIRLIIGIMILTSLII